MSQPSARAKPQARKLDDGCIELENEFLVARFDPAGGDGHSRVLTPSGDVLCASDSDQEVLLCAAIETED